MLGPRLSEAVLNSSVPIQRLNDMVTRIGAYILDTRDAWGGVGIYRSCANEGSGHMVPTWPRLRLPGA